MRLKRILGSSMLMLLGTLLPLVFFEVVLRFMPVSDSLMMLPVDSSNPYTRFKENRDVTLSRGYSFSLVTTKHVNNYGFLNDNDYDVNHDSPLLSIIGDSFVAAAEVENMASMHGILSQDTKGRARVYSFGSAGSPLSNYLAYASYATREFNADALVFIIIGNDFDESLTKYKETPGMHYFSDESGDLELARRDYKPTWIKRVARRSALARYITLNLQVNWGSIENAFRADGDRAINKFVGNTRADFSAERIADSIRVVEAFFKELPLRASVAADKILFVVDGMRPHLYNPTTLKRAEGSYFDLMRKYFIGVATAQGYEVIDMQPTFIKEYESTGVRVEFPTDMHWNEVGHALTAEKIKQSNVYRSLFTQ